MAPFGEDYESCTRYYESLDERGNIRNVSSFAGTSTFDVQTDRVVLVALLSMDLQATTQS